MLRVDGLHVRYGRVVAVRDASCEVRAHEIVGIIGANGAGKSSLLHAITGVVPASAGDITLNGEPIRGRSSEEIARRGLILVPEGRQTFTRLTVAENLRVATTLVGSRVDADAAVEKCLDRFPILRRFHDRPAGLLSGGEQQQLVIARALIAGPRLLALDEPSLGLAPKLVAEVFEVIREIHADGVPVLLVEQNAARTVALADRVYVMVHGLLSEADPARLTTPDLIKAYLGGGPAD